MFAETETAMDTEPEVEAPDLEDVLLEWTDYVAASAPESALFRRELERLAHTLFSDCKRLGVDRVKIAQQPASVKGCFEADVIVYVDREPPYHALLEDVKSTVSMHFRWQEHGHSLTSLVVDQYSVIAVELRSGLRFNVMLSKNFVKAEEKRLDESALNRRQYERSVQWLKQFRNQPMKLLTYSAGLSPTATLFFDEVTKDPVAVALLRLCSKWNQSIVGLPYIHKRSSTVQLLALAAFLDKRETRRTLTSCFRRFLENWADIANATFCKHFDYSEKHQLYYHRDVASGLRDERPLLLDPVDPFANRLKPFKDVGALAAFRFCAQATLLRLSHAEMKSLASPDSLVAKQDVSRMFNKASIRA